MTLDEIRIANTSASFEPALDYVVTKMPRFPFDKFANANNSLSTQMKATGEVMSIGRTVEESLLKAIRSLEIGLSHLYHRKFDGMSEGELLNYIRIGTDDRIYAIAGFCDLVQALTALQRQPLLTFSLSVNYGISWRKKKKSRQISEISRCFEKQRKRAFPIR